MRVEGLGFRVEGGGYRVQSSGCTLPPFDRAKVVERRDCEVAGGHGEGALLEGLEL